MMSPTDTPDLPAETWPEPPTDAKNWPDPGTRSWRPGEALAAARAGQIKPGD